MSYLICLNLSDIKSKIWRRSLNELLILFEDWNRFETVTELVADGLMQLYADSEPMSKRK